MKFPFFNQIDQKDCGPTCLKMIAAFHGKTLSLQKIRRMAETTREGTTLNHLARAAEDIGFTTQAVRLDFETLKEEVQLPCIASWQQNHFVVVYRISPGKVWVADPAHGPLEYSYRDFAAGFSVGGEGGEGFRSDTMDTEDIIGVALLLEPSARLGEMEISGPATSHLGTMWQYLSSQRPLLTQLTFSLLVGSVLQLVLPFLTQSIVDIGIRRQDTNFLWMVGIAQMVFFLARWVGEALRGWLLLHLSTRVNLSILSDFFSRLLRLPIRYFDTRLTGDLLQRIADQHRIETLLNSGSLNAVFSLINLVLFGTVMAVYSLKIFSVFLVGSLLYLCWILLFMRARRQWDYRRFTSSAKERSLLIDIINGMRDIKLFNAEKEKSLVWEQMQTELFSLRGRELALEQKQSLGGLLINEAKNIVITLLSASMVLEGQLTMGMMLAIVFINGQLNVPLGQLIIFINDWQDAKIAMDRMEDIAGQTLESEEGAGQVDVPAADITLDQVVFRYQGTVDPVLSDINFTIEKNKVTAIVGASGSGKTTLVKLLLGFYAPGAGSISVGKESLAHLDAEAWRSQCGTVLQEGYLFNDTIEANIALGVSRIYPDQMRNALQMAGLEEFIKGLPSGLKTKVGNENMEVSSGQKQRILIARSIYKNPQYLFFDEATNALDATNEKTITGNLNMFFRGRTVVIVAHRLSTVKHADQIIVLDKGTIVEKGTHRDLVSHGGVYYRLIQNQLDLELLTTPVHS